MFRPSTTTAPTMQAAGSNMGTGGLITGAGGLNTGAADMDLSLFGPPVSDPVSRTGSTGVETLSSANGLHAVDLDMFTSGFGSATNNFATAGDSMSSTSSALGLDFSDLYKQGPSKPKALLSEAAKAILDRMADLSYMVPPKLSIPAL